MNFEKKVFQFIGKNKLIVPGGLVIVGFSGGADSMALIQTLVALRHDLGIRLHAAHFNHRLRGQALRDERFVRRWCGRLNVPLTVACRRGGKTIRLSEDDARQMRFKFFVNLALRLKAQSVALAHTRSDLAETVLMRLLRGSGLYGLRGILPQRLIKDVTFVRPLMGVARSDVEDYLKLKHVPFCTDATNRSLRYARNKIRLKLLPLLAREYNPQITDILTDLAHTAYEDYAFLADCAQRRFEKSVIISSGRVKISLKQMSALHPAIQRLLIRQMAEVLTHDLSALTFEHVRAVEDWMTKNEGSMLHLPHHLTVSKTKKFLELSYA